MFGTERPIPNNGRAQNSKTEIPNVEINHHRKGHLIKSISLDLSNI